MKDPGFVLRTDIYNVQILLDLFVFQMKTTVMIMALITEL